MRYVITKSKLCLKLFNEADDSDYSICVCIFLSIIYLSNVETAYVAGGVFGPLFIRPIFVIDKPRTEENRGVGSDVTRRTEENRGVGSDVTR